MGDHRYQTLGEAHCDQCQGKLEQFDDTQELEEALFAICCDDYNGLNLACPRCRLHYICCPTCSGYDETDWHEDKLPQETGPIQLCKFVGIDYVDDQPEYTDGQGMRPNRPFLEAIPEDAELGISLSDFNVVEHIQKFQVNGGQVDWPDSETLQRYSDETIDNSQILLRWYGDKEQFYVTTDWILTGPDGGMPVVWKCPQCRKLIRVTDK